MIFLGFKYLRAASGAWKSITSSCVLLWLEIDFLSQNKGNITFEITPQHLTFCAPDCYDKIGTYAQMNPPIRDKTHQNRLWYAIKNNYTIVSYGHGLTEIGGWRPISESKFV